MEGVLHFALWALWGFVMKGIKDDSQFKIAQSAHHPIRSSKCCLAVAIAMGVVSAPFLISFFSADKTSLKSSG